MIAKLKGLVDSSGDDWAVIDVGGVGYLVFCSGRTLSRLPKAGEAVAVQIETQVREDHIHLYGFIDTFERDWFRLLTTVQGVGSKVALAILSVAPPDKISQAIAAQDKGVLTQASGVGPKLATRILSELKDKAGTLALGAAFAPAASGGGVAPITLPADGAGGGAADDAVSALVNLGYKRIEAYGAVAKAAQALGDKADVAGLIRAGLKDLAPKDLNTPKDLNR